MTDDVFKGIDKFIGGFHGIDINDMRVTADEDLGVLISIDSSDGRFDGISSNGFMTSVDIEHGKGRLIGITDCGAKLNTTTSVLCRIGKGRLDDIRWFPEEELAK